MLRMRWRRFRTPKCFIFGVFILYMIFFILSTVIFSGTNIPSVDLPVTVIPHNSHTDNELECGFTIHKMHIFNRPLFYYFEVFRHKDDEIVFLFSPNVPPGIVIHNIGLPKKSQITFSKFKKNEPFIHSIPVKEAFSTCEEDKFTLPKGDTTRYHGGVLSAMIYKCKIPKEMQEYKEFHVGLDCDIYYEKFHVIDCREHLRNEPTKYLANVITNEPNDQIVKWLKYMKFIGVDRVNVFLHNPSPVKLLFFFRNYDSNFLYLKPITGKHWKVLQTIVLADCIFRHPSSWIISNDIDEYPVFFPNLEDFIKRQPPDISSAKISTLMFSSRDGDYSNMMSTMFKYSPVVKVVSCHRERKAFYEIRPKPIFRPDRVINLENHYACPKEGYKVYSSEFKDAFIAHYYERPGRYLPSPYINYNEKKLPDKIVWRNHMGYEGCYYEMIDVEKSSSMKELFLAYDKILNSCDGFLCEKNEMELKDPKLIEIKKNFKIITNKRLRDGYTEEEVMSYHESIVSHCRHTHETANIRDYDLFRMYD